MKITFEAIMHEQNPYRIPGLSISILGALILCIGFGMTALGYSVDGEVPFYSPFVGAARFALLIGGLLLIWGQKKAEDEFIRQLRLEAFQAALLVTAVLVVCNQGLYFFTDQLMVQAIDLLIAQIWLQLAIFGWNLKQAAK